MHEILYPPHEFHYSIITRAYYSLEYHSEKRDNLIHLHMQLTREPEWPNYQFLVRLNYLFIFKPSNS